MPVDIGMHLRQLPSACFLFPHFLLLYPTLAYSLPGIQWSGIYGMSMPMFTSFTVPDEYMFDILPTLKKKNYDIGEATVVTYGKIIVDIKGMTTNVEVVRALTQALGIPVIEDGDTRKLEAALKALGPADFQRAWKAQNPDKEPVHYTPADFPDAQHVIYGYRVELINGDEFVTKGERDWWRLSAAYQQAEHQSNGKDWRVVFKVQHKDA